MSPDAPRGTESLDQSLHKTFTDCYLAPSGGMEGGGWGYALNSNDAAGSEVEAIGIKEQMMDESKRMLALYVIGWESTMVNNKPTAASWRNTLIQRRRTRHI